MFRGAMQWKTYSFPAIEAMLFCRRTLFPGRQVGEENPSEVGIDNCRIGRSLSGMGRPSRDRAEGLAATENIGID